MYCPSCAHPVKDGLKYCNSCGARIAAVEKDDSPAKMLDDVLETLFWTTAVSLGILVGLVAVMLGNHVNADIVGIVAVFYLATVGMITFMLARQVPKLIDARLRSVQPSADNVEHAQLRSPTTAQIEDFREPAMSVTDHTTKTLDKMPVGKYGKT